MLESRLGDILLIPFNHFEVFYLDEGQQSSHRGGTMIVCTPTVLDQALKCLTRVLLTYYNFITFSVHVPFWIFDFIHVYWPDECSSASPLSLDTVKLNTSQQYLHVASHAKGLQNRLHPDSCWIERRVSSSSQTSSTTEWDPLLLEENQSKR